jgi:SAM-dependent methyltransferase
MVKTGSKTGSQRLDKAYTLQTPADNAAYYRDFAQTYDSGFVAETGYVYPREIARLFEAEAGAADRPVLDVGAGTGLVAAHLGDLPVDGPVDGIDISPEMLARAAAKGLYRNRIVADLTGPLAIADASYGALISAGTFTHGHVGPVCLPELLRIARPGALFCLGVNLAVFDSAGFGSDFARLVAEGRIGPVDFRAVTFYVGVEHEHSADNGVAAVFRKR